MRAALCIPPRDPRKANRKTGPACVTSYLSSDTCPSDCAMARTRACYAKNDNVAIHWRRLDTGAWGASFVQFLDTLAETPTAGLIYRGSVAGDQPPDPAAFRAYVARAARFKVAFSYSHAWRRPELAREFRSACALGFTINASCETLADVDAAFAAGLPAAVVRAPDMPKVEVTPAGRRVVRCPAFAGDVSCSTCGNGRPLCARPERDFAIGFPAHGATAKRALPVLS